MRIPFCSAIVFFCVVVPVIAQNEGIVVLKDIPYVSGGDERRQLDLYLPGNARSAEKPLPLVVVIHGGGWFKGDKGQTRFADWTRFFVSEGYAAASINYRLAPRFPMPAPLIDCKSALRWLRANASEYNLDPERFAVMGTSAGGHLAALLGTTRTAGEYDRGEHLDRSSQVCAVCDFCGPSDIALFRKTQEKLVDDAFGVDPDEKSMRKMSPLFQADAGAAPMLIVHAARDRAVPIEQSKHLYDALIKAGVESRFVTLAAGGHTSKEFQSESTKKEIREFFSRHLGKTTGR